MKGQHLLERRAEEQQPWVLPVSGTVLGSEHIAEDRFQEGKVQKIKKK